MIVYAKETYSITGSQVGDLTALLIGSQAAANLLWGYVGDRLGHKAVLATGAACLALATATIWLGDAWGWLWGGFSLLGIGLAANAVSGMNIVLEFGHPKDRPTYIGLTNTSLAPITMLAPLVGGWLSERLGFATMFMTATIVSALGSALLSLWFREPRRLELPEPIS